MRPAPALDRPTDADRRHLERAIALAQEALVAGSSAIGCVIVGRDGRVVSEGRNHSGEPWPSLPHRIGDSGLAHAEMDAFFRVGRLEDAPGCTLYSSLEPCLMCGGAIGMLHLGRVVWACDDPWGGSGRLIAWNEHPALRETVVVPHPFADLEREAALLFAPEARKVYGPDGWAAWSARYPDVCAEAERMLAEVPPATRETRGPPPEEDRDPGSVG